MGSEVRAADFARGSDQQVRPHGTAELLSCAVVDSLLNTRAWPTIIVDAGARLLSANDLAWELFESQSDWGINACLLVHRDEPTRVHLHKQIRAMADKNGPGPVRLAHFVDTAESEQTLVSMTRIERAAMTCGTRHAQGSPAVLITLNDGHRRQIEQSCKLLLDAFGFTPAESRLTFALLDGHTPQAFSEVAGVRISTVRWHLRNALAKTGCSGQRDLVRLVVSLLDS